MVTNGVGRAGEDVNVSWIGLVTEDGYGLIKCEKMCTTIIFTVPANDANDMCINTKI